MSDKVYLNGKFLERENATVSITDFGFNYGAGVYDIALIINKKLFQVDEHLARLKSGAEQIGLPLQVSDLSGVSHKLVELNGLEDGFLYLQATYGNYVERSHLLPEKIVPTILVFTQKMSRAPKENFLQGVPLKSIPDLRWSRCNIKSISLLINVMDYNRALSEKFYEGVLFDEASGNVTECTTANFFCVKGGALFTTPESGKILSGITRANILRLAKKAGILVREENFKLPFLLEADEVFLTSTLREVMPVNRIDQKKIALSPGPVTMQLMRAHAELIERETGAPHWKRELFF